MQEPDIIQIKMYIKEEESTGTYDVIKVGKHLYQLPNNDPFNELLTYGTIIEVYPETKEEGIYTFKSVFKESEYRVDVFGLPSVLNETELRTVGQKIMDEGGYWEVIFGGMAYVNLPKTSNFNVDDELNRLIKAKQ